MEIINLIKERFGEKIQFVETIDYPTVKVGVKDFFNFIKEIKSSSELGFDFLLDLTAAELDECFEAVYHLMNLKNNQIIRIKVCLDKDNPSIDSITGLYKAADMQEREAYDLLGINYDGHPNLKRILCPDDFEGHPLRKAFSVQDRGSK